MTVLSTTQMTLDFEAGISKQSESLKEFLRDKAIPALWQEKGTPKKYVAAELELSPSELTRKLSDNPNDPRNFTIEDLERYLDTLGDLSPLFYLLDKYARKEQDRAELERKIEELQGLLNSSDTRNQKVRNL